MAIFFMIVQFLSFVAIGLYGTVLGAVWPVAHVEFGVDSTWIVLYSTLLMLGTTFGSLLSEKIREKVSVGRMVFLGVLLMSGLSFLMSIAPAFLLLAALGFGLGFSGGVVDTLVNSYMTFNYKPFVLSWLHSMWGVGALIAPIIAGYFIKIGNWRGSYQAIALIQLLIATLLFFCIPQWENIETFNKPHAVVEQPEEKLRITQILGLRGAIPALISMLVYGGIEAVANHWGSTFLVDARGLTQASAARGASFFFTGMMVARVLTGFVAMRVDYRKILPISQTIAVAGGICLLLPLGSLSYMIGFFLLGAGASIMPSGTLQLSPQRFGSHAARHMISLQLSASFIGSMVAPPVVGLLSKGFTIGVLPVFLLVSGVATLVLVGYLNSLPIKSVS